MAQRKLVIRNEVGLHARPAAKFVETAQRFNCQISISFHGRTVNGKSLLQVLTLGAGKEAEISLQASGPDEQEALTTLAKLVDQGFLEATS